MEESIFDRLVNIFNLFNRAKERGFRGKDPLFLITDVNDNGKANIRCANCMRFVSPESTCCGNYVPSDAMEQALSYNWKFDFEGLSLREVKELKETH